MRQLAFIGGMMLALGMCASGAAAERHGPVAVEEIRLHLFYEETGTFSKNILMGPFAAHNTIIGSGDADEPAIDVLAAVVLSGVPGQPFEGLRIQVRSKRTNKILAQRKFHKHILGREGRVVQGILVQDATCEPLEVTATLGASRKTVTFPFACGE